MLLSLFWSQHCHSNFLNSVCLLEQINSWNVNRNNLPLIIFIHTLEYFPKAFCTLVMQPLPYIPTITNYTQLWWVPNVVVAHQKEGIEAVHLASGRTICKVKISNNLHINAPLSLKSKVSARVSTCLFSLNIQRQSL